MVVQRLYARIELGVRRATKLVECVVTFSPPMILTLFGLIAFDMPDRCALLVLSEFLSQGCSDLRQIKRVSIQVSPCFWKADYVRSCIVFNMPHQVSDLILHFF